MRILSWTLAILLLTAIPVASGETSVNKGVACSVYEYTLEVDGINYSLQTGRNKTDTEGIDFLRNEIAQANLDINVMNLTSKLVGVSTCNKPDSLASCATFSCQICVESDGSVKEQLVENMSLAKIRQFISKLNEEHKGSIRLTYEYPIRVRTSLVITFVGVNSPLSPNDQNKLSEEIKSSFGAILSVEGIELTNVVVVLQGAVVLNQRGRATRELVLFARPDADSVALDGRLLPGFGSPIANKAEVALLGTCYGAEDCTSEKFNKAVDVRAPSYVQNHMLTYLQVGGKPSDYFNRVSSAQVPQSGVSGSTLLDINITEILAEATRDIPPIPSSKSEVEEEQTPWWIWILAGGSASILIVGGTWTAAAVQRRNKDEYLRRAFDQHATASIVEKEQIPRGGGLFGLRNRNANTMTEESDIPQTPEDCTKRPTVSFPLGQSATENEEDEEANKSTPMSSSQDKAAEKSSFLDELLFTTTQGGKDLPDTPAADVNKMVNEMAFCGE